MRVLITAGPTREPLDAVRFLSNRSSGTLGIALAHAAAEAGHDTTLLLGPVGDGQAQHLADLPVAVKRINFETVDNLQQELETSFTRCDVLIMAAAVGDYRLDPSKTAKKQVKTERKGQLTLNLVATPDVVAGIAQTKRIDQTIVAFALEEAAVLEQRAVEKMKRKGVDAIVANPLKTMDATDIDPVLFIADGKHHAPGPMTKPAFAQWLIQQVSAVHCRV